MGLVWPQQVPHSFQPDGFHTWINTALSPHPPLLQARPTGMGAPLARTCQTFPPFIVHRAALATGQTSLASPHYHAPPGGAVPHAATEQGLPLSCGALRVITARRRGGWEGTGRVAFLYASSGVPRGPHGHSRQPPCPALSERGNSPAIAAPLPSGPSDRGVSSAPALRPLFMAPV